MVFALLFFNISLGFSQRAHEDEEPVKQNKAWCFGINVGAAFANKYQANFYNGAEGNQNALSYILNNSYNRADIRRVLNDTFSIVGMPTKMRYNPAAAIGFILKKNFNNNIGVFVQFNYMKFTASDMFTLKIGNMPSGYSDSVNTLDCKIWGKEQRINIDIGVSGQMYFAPKIYGFLEGGFNLNNTRVVENKIAIKTLEYSIINIYGGQPYVPNTQLQEYKVHEGGLGIGAFVSPGIKFQFNDNVAVDILGSVYWAKINLMHYNTFRPQFNLGIRFMFSTEFVKSL